MSETKLRLFNRVRTLSSAAVAIATVLSLLFSQWLGTNSLGWQLVLATIALAIGIPHGALDHLVTLPKAAPIRMALFIILYVAIALLAIYAILRWNVWGFIFVVIMSATHFGIGDAAFLSEKDSLDGSSRIPAWFYAPAAGLLPVAIPLVNSRSTDALEKVNPALINWHSGFTTEILMAVAVVTTLCLLALLQRKRYRDALDLLLLAALASFAPPLVALPSTSDVGMQCAIPLVLPHSYLIQSAYLRGRPGQAFAAAVIPGLPALVGTLIFVVILAGFSQQDLSDKFLWLTLVTIWALTVPHMIVTARLDRAALRK